MAFDNINVDTSTREGIFSFRETIDDLLVVGRVCHCTRIDYTPGVNDIRGKTMYYTNDNGEENAICSWTLRMNPSEDRVTMYRLVTASDTQLSKVRFSRDESWSDIGNRLFNAIEEVRGSAGIRASQEDLDAIRAAILANLPSD